MSSPLRTIRAFSAELMKLAAKIQDADIQKLLADRKGEDYLSGGKLPSNSIEDEQQAKVANYDGIGVTAAGMHDLGAKKKKKNTYQKARDYVGTGIKGGLTGIGILGGVNAMRGRFKSPEGFLATHQAARAAQRAATVGAGVAIADRAYRHDDVPGLDKKAAIVNPGMGNALKSPATAAATARRTGGFKSTVRRAIGKPPQTVQLGKKFRLP